jgi:hypothetical protein
MSSSPGLSQSFVCTLQCLDRESADLLYLFIGVASTLAETDPSLEIVGADVTKAHRKELLYVGERMMVGSRCGALRDPRHGRAHVATTRPLFHSFFFPSTSYMKTAIRLQAIAQLGHSSEATLLLPSASSSPSLLPSVWLTPLLASSSSDYLLLSSQ